MNCTHYDLEIIIIQPMFFVMQLAEDTLLQYLFWPSKSQQRSRWPDMAPVTIRGDENSKERMDSRPRSIPLELGRRTWWRPVGAWRSRSEALSTYRGPLIYKYHPLTH